jgi:hypothetical protein
VANYISKVRQPIVLESLEGRLVVISARQKVYRCMTMVIVVMMRMAVIIIIIIIIIIIRLLSQAVSSWLFS